jgi:uncharacterized protein
MPGETELSKILKTMTPILNEGVYVFCTVADLTGIHMNDVIGTFREKESITVIISKNTANTLHLSFSSEFAWITLSVHSSLDAIGLTAAFSTALSKEGISCNVLAAYYHDHIFVNSKDAGKAMSVLSAFSQQHQ